MSDECPSPWSAKLIQMVSMVLKSLVDDEKAVKVTAVMGAQCIIIEAKVAPDEYRKVVGRGGRHIQALSTLVNAAGGKFGERVVLSLVEPRNRRRRSPLRWSPDGDFGELWRDHK